MEAEWFTFADDGGDVGGDCCYWAAERDVIQVAECEIAC